MLTPASLILVCLLPSPRDLEIARLLGWYRIPFRSAPKVVAVDNLAFYQPGSFGDEAGKIEWMAAVRGHELTTRGELLKDESDHPRAGEEYYKIQLGPLGEAAAPGGGGEMEAADLPVHNGGIFAQSPDAQRPGGAKRRTSPALAIPARTSTK